MVKRTILWAIILLVVLAGCTAAEERQEPSEVVMQAEATDTKVTPTGTPSQQNTEPANTAANSQDEIIPSKTEIDGGNNQTAEQVRCTGVLTSTDQEGPYYKAGSPQKEDLIENDMPGNPIVISGGVFDQDCNPISGAIIDFWQADTEGVYDNSGYILRGHVISDEKGFYRIRTMEPGPYTGRPPHIHVKVFSPGGEELITTQLYFPGGENSSDVRSAPDLLVTYLETDANGNGQVLFNFVVQAP